MVAATTDQLPIVEAVSLRPPLEGRLRVLDQLLAHPGRVVASGTKEPQFRMRMSMYAHVVTACGTPVLYADSTCISASLQHVPRRGTPPWAAATAMCATMPRHALGNGTPLPHALSRRRSARHRSLTPPPSMRNSNATFVFLISFPCISMESPTSAPRNREF